MKILAALATTLSFSMAFARPAYFNSLRTGFPQGQLKARCQTCHDGAGLKLNAFGKEFATLKTEIGMDRAADIWFRIGTLDSDQDGRDNATEISQGTNPGKKD